MAAPQRSAAALVIIDDLDIVGVAVAPHETHPPLVVHPNGVLSGPVPFEGFEPGRRRRYGRTEVAEVGGGMEHDELAERTALDVGRDLPALSPPEQPFGLGIGERLDHRAGGGWSSEG